MASRPRVDDCHGRDPHESVIILEKDRREHAPEAQVFPQRTRCIIERPAYTDIFVGGGRPLEVRDELSIHLGKVTADG